MGPRANIFVHEKCRKDYTHSGGIEQQKCKAEEEAAAIAGSSTPKKQTLRSVSEVFNFPYSQCILRRRSGWRKGEGKISGAGSASEERYYGTQKYWLKEANLYFACNTSNCVTVRPVRDHLTPKVNITCFIRNLMLNIFLFDNFFEKSCTFRENRKKLFRRRIWKFFRERRRLTLKINITFFFIHKWGIEYYLLIFSKNV